MLANACPLVQCKQEKETNLSSADISAEEVRILILSQECMTAHLFRIITQCCLHLLNIATLSSVMLKKTLAYGNVLIISVEGSNYCVPIMEPCATFAHRFS